MPPKTQSKPPLSFMLQSARSEMTAATNQVMKKYGLPPCLMDGILSSLLADIRSESNSELIFDLQRQQEDKK